MEDYLEVIYELVRQKGYATTVDISDYLNVSSPSVTRMMKKLHETGFIRYEKYRGMSLTDKGIEHHLHSETLMKLEDFVRSLKATHKIQ